MLIGLPGSPYRLTAVEVKQVIAVFDHGAAKRAADPKLPRGNSRFTEHVDHARRHWHERRFGWDDGRCGVEDESGLDHRAHVIARLLLAIASVCDDWRNN
jgi:hypothetical protein